MKSSTYKSVKFTIIFIIFSMISVMTCYAFNLDETVEDDIRKNYNPTKLIKDTGVETASSEDEKLPELPKILKNQPQQTTTTTTNTKAAAITTTNNNTNGTYTNTDVSESKTNLKIRRYKVIDVISKNAISDSMPEGTTLTFITTKPIRGKGYTINRGTTIKGRIVNSHSPQISGNGGLIVIRIDSMSYNNKYIALNGYITKANGKKVFFNNIKGRRTYLKTMYKKGNWGRTMFGNMCTTTVKLGHDTSTLLLSPFPLMYGTICLGANTIISPVTAFFSKGQRINIPAKSQFKIRLSESAYL